MSKLETLNTYQDLTAAPAAQALTLQQHLPLLVDSIERLRLSVPQPLTQSDLQQSIRPLLVEQANHLNKIQKHEFLILKHKQAEQMQQMQGLEEQNEALTLYVIGLALVSMVLVFGLMYIIFKLH